MEEMYVIGLMSSYISFVSISFVSRASNAASTKVRIFRMDSVCRLGSKNEAAATNIPSAQDL